MHARFFATVLLLCSTAAVGGAPKQAILGHRSALLLTVDGLTFKDLDRNGKLDPYEDWRLPAEVRVADLLIQRLNLPRQGNCTENNLQAAFVGAF